MTTYSFVGNLAPAKGGNHGKARLFDVEAATWQEGLTKLLIKYNHRSARIYAVEIDGSWHRIVAAGTATTYLIDHDGEEADRIDLAAQYNTFELGPKLAGLPKCVQERRAAAANNA